MLSAHANKNNTRARTQQRDIFFRSKGDLINSKQGPGSNCQTWIKQNWVSDVLKHKFVNRNIFLIFHYLNNEFVSRSRTWTCFDVRASRHDPILLGARTHYLCHTPPPYALSRQLLRVRIWHKHASAWVGAAYVLEMLKTVWRHDVQEESPVSLWCSGTINFCQKRFRIWGHPKQLLANTVYENRST